MWITICILNDMDNILSILLYYMQ